MAKLNITDIKTKGEVTIVTVEQNIYGSVAKIEIMGIAVKSIKFFKNNEFHSEMVYGKTTNRKVLTDKKGSYIKINTYCDDYVKYYI